MKGNMVVTGTITYALRGRDILRKKGFKATVERNLGGSNRYGCGDGIAVIGDIDGARRILKDNGIKVLDVAPII